MSFNIINWKTKELKDFKIPFDEFFKHKRKNFHPETEKKLTNNDLILFSGESVTT